MIIAFRDLSYYAIPNSLHVEVPMRAFGVLLAAAAALASPAHASSGGAYWLDGNFTDPAPKPGTFAILDTGERYGVWRVIGAPGNVAWVSGTYTHNGFSFPAQGATPQLQASPWVNLAGVSMTATGIMHAPVATNMGLQYTLTFYVGNLVNPNGNYGMTSTVQVYENARLIGTAVNSGGAGSTKESPSASMIMRQITRRSLGSGVHRRLSLGYAESLRADAGWGWRWRGRRPQADRRASANPSQS